ncbi:hypothetical protein ACRB68_41400 [Actinomadura sp. RB68]|uniref:Uncharacterized protein n=2 Tax=Actinomadura macrotermitis TaxID=2585200 RepID=A0A7K0BXZ5_9ACTN|nr:hypothetical protein [Actinomadura macrotermitis]
MRFRNSRLRAKVTAPPVSPTALWAFAARATPREGVNLPRVGACDARPARGAGARGTGRVRATELHSGAIDPVYRAHPENAAPDDERPAKDIRTPLELNRIREVPSQEDALTSGHIRPAGHTQFTGLAGSRPMNTVRALIGIRHCEPVICDGLPESSEPAPFQNLEDRNRRAVPRNVPRTAPQPPETAAEPEEEPPVPEDPTTPSGLPVRVPQTSLAPPLCDGAPQDADPEEPARTPAEIQRIMGSYQRGTRRGRSDAAETLGKHAEGEDEQ